MRRVDTAAFYKGGSFYGHSRVSTIPIPPEPDPDTPIDPCTLCPEGYNCENGECVKPPEPGGGGSEIINPQIIPPDKEIAEDTPENEEVECVLLSQTRNGIVRYENGYITGADEFSGGRYKISTECYSGVIMEGKLGSTESINNYLLFGYGQEYKTISAGGRYQDLIKGDTRIRITINAEDYSYRIDVRNKISETVQTDWITIETGTFFHEQGEAPGWMIVGVYGAAVIFTLMANETSGVVPVSVDTVPEALPSSATGIYPRSNINIGGTVTDEDGNTVRTKRFFTFIDGQEYENGKVKYEGGKLRVLPGVYSDLGIAIGNEPFPKTNNNVCSTYVDIVFKSRYPQYENQFDIGIGVDITRGTGPVYEHDWAYLSGVNCPDGGQLTFNETSYNIDSTKEYRLFCEFSRGEYSNDFNAYFYVGNYATDTWTLLDSTSTSYNKTAYDNYGDTVFSGLTMRVETFDSSSEDGGVDIIYASNGNVSCNQVLYASDRGTITHNYLDKTITIADDRGNTIVIADRNAGATEICKPGDTRSHNNCGDIFQWGNGQGFNLWGTFPTSQNRVCTTGYGPQNPYQENVFRDVRTWDMCDNIDLWGGSTAPQGDLNNLILNTHIPNGFHIPTRGEADDFLGMLRYICGTTPTRATYTERLFMPCWGGGSQYNYWTSTGIHNLLGYMFGEGSNITVSVDISLANFIRPFKSVNYGTTVYED